MGVHHLLVRLVARELGVEVEHHESGGAQAEARGEPAHDDLGDEHLRALTGSAELAHVRPQVVALDDLSSGDKANLDGVDADLVVGTVLDDVLLDEVVAGSTAVVHLAAETGTSGRRVEMSYIGG